MSNNKKGNLVVAGALCTCQFGKIPAKLEVHTQTKRFVNVPDGTQKLMATHKDVGETFAAPYFGSCSMMNNNPCAAFITSWEDFYDGVKIETGGMPLLDSSKATCVAGTKDCIHIIWHGQSVQIGVQHVAAADSKTHVQINPFVQLSSMDHEY